MSWIVLDASVTLSWCFPDEQTPSALGVLDLLKAGAQALVPAFWCSEHSLQSPPVIREIERALQKEDREHRNVLFPVRIDDYLFDEWEHPRKADVVGKVAGDFRGWENDVSYSKAFPRFLHALNRPQQASKAG